MKERLIIRVVVMQTIAANLGSMLTPIGNPQNLYLQGISGLGVGEFMFLMLPYTIVSFFLLSLCVLFRCENERIQIRFDNDIKINQKREIAVYITLFLICILTVARVIDYRITLLIVVIMAAVTDSQIFFSVDYILLATFAAFFVFVGNIGRISMLNTYIKSVIDGHECIIGVISSQLISNVPAALLLSGFTNNFNSLIIGVNLGGLGTLIASMASLISFKFIGHENKSLRGRYLICFTAVNIVLLAVLMGVYYVLGRFYN